MEDRLNQCVHVKPDGTRCRAAGLKGSDRCFYHNPSTADAHREAAKRGAITRNARKSHPWTDSYFTLVQGAQNAGPVLLTPLLDAFLKVREGRMDTRTANSLAYLATIIAQMGLPQSPVTGPPKTEWQIKCPKWEAVMRRIMNWNTVRAKEVMREMGIAAPLPPDDPRMHEVIMRVFPPNEKRSTPRSSAPQNASQGGGEGGHERPSAATQSPPTPCDNLPPQK